MQSAEPRLCGLAALGRLQQDTHVRLGLRNLYIVPSRFGLLWLAAAALLQVVGIQTQRNGSLLLSFLLLAVLLLALHLTHFNLQGLDLCCGEPRPGFADAVLRYPIQLHSRCPREAINLRLAAAEGTATTLRLGEGTSTLALAWRSHRRGLQRPGILLISGTAPLGLFVCWSRWQPNAAQLVYPSRRPGPVAIVQPQGTQLMATRDTTTGAEGAEHWQDLRPQRPQDSQSRVAWKVLAQGRGRLTKTFHDPAGAPPWLAPAPSVPLEEALEHLSAAVWQCSLRGESFGLALPDQTIAPGRGREHRDRCLQALALSP